MSKIKVSINGKFLSVPSTGVQRVAKELVSAMDNILSRTPAIKERLDIQVLAPNDAVKLKDLKHIRFQQAGCLSGQFKNNLWEQMSIPFLTKGQKLLSLCNLSCMFKLNAIVMIHDAQVYTSPQSYSAAFRGFYRFILPLLGKTSEYILTVSAFSKAELVQFGVVKPEKVVVVHNGCDHVLHYQSDASVLSSNHLKPKQYFLAQANTQKHKNIALLFKAFSDPALAQQTLVLYGPASKEKFEASSIEVPDNVIFAGKVSDGALKALYENATATLTPSLTEGFGLQPLEGMILGTPAIVSHGGALPEVCGEAAFYADADKADQWVSAIQKVVQHPDPNQLSIQAKAHAKHYTWENAALSIIRQLL